MGFVSLQPLVNVLPGTLSPGTVAAFSDSQTEGVLRGALLCIDGDRWSLVARTAEDGAVWGEVTYEVEAGILPAHVERLNRVLKGTGMPRVETDWRTRQPALLAPGRRYALPVSVAGALTGEGTLRTSTLVIRPGAGAVAPMVAPPTVPAPGAVASTPAVVAPPVPAPWDRPRDRTVSPIAHTPVAAPVAAPEPVKAVRLEPVKGDDIWTWPTVVDSIVVAPGVMDSLDKVWSLHVGGRKQVVALTGPAGTGKTSLAYDLAARHKVPYYKVDTAGAVTFADWAGFQSATERNGATVTEWSPSGFIRAIRADGPMGGQPRIVIIDEVNRAESSGALNALLPVCDHTGTLYIPDALRTVPIDPAVLFIFTANIGSGHTGTVAMDIALEDRVTHWVEMLYPAEKVEVDLVVSRSGIDRDAATRLVRAATQVRGMADKGEIGKGIGPRKVLQAADKVAAGFSLVDAATSTWVMSYPNEGKPSDRDNVRSIVDAALRA